MQRSTRLLLVLALAFPLVSPAQFSKGTRMAGASAGSIFLNAGQSDQQVTGLGSITASIRGYGLNFTPSIGWFLNSKTAIGLNVLVNPTHNKTTYEENGSTFERDITNEFNAGLGVFARNYFGSQGSLLPFGQVNLDGGIATRRIEGFIYGGSGVTAYKDTYEGKTSGGFFTNLGLSLGVTKMLGKQVGIDLQAGYNFHYTKNTLNITTYRDIGLDGGSPDETKRKETVTKDTDHRLVISLGFQVFLEKNK